MEMQLIPSKRTKTDNGVFAKLVYRAILAYFNINKGFGGQTS